VPLAAAALAALVPGLRAPAAHAAGAACAECGMRLDPATPPPARIGSGEGALLFCDVGDLVAYLREHPEGTAAAEVRVGEDGAWLAAARSFYVEDPDRFPTPMGWGIVAFPDRAAAQAAGTPLTLGDLLGARR